ncbi:hypothetical protein ABZP36_030112 [Zizania latifolia]
MLGDDESFFTLEWCLGVPIRMLPLVRSRIVCHNPCHGLVLVNYDNNGTESSLQNPITRDCQYIEFHLFHEEWEHGGDGGNGCAGLVHVVGKMYWMGEGSPHAILAFDICALTFKIVPTPPALPPDEDGDDSDRTILSELARKLCVTHTCLETDTMTIWAMRVEQVWATEHLAAAHRRLAGECRRFKNDKLNEVSGSARVLDMDAGSNGGSSSGSRKGAHKEIAARKKIVKPHERRRAEVAAPEKVEDMVRSTQSEMVKRLRNLQNSLRQTPPIPHGTDTPTRGWLMNLQNSLRQPPPIPAGTSHGHGWENAAKLPTAIFLQPGSSSHHNLQNSLRQPPPTTNPAGTDHSRVSMACGQGYRVVKGDMSYGQFQSTIIRPPGGVSDEATSNPNPNNVKLHTDEVKLPEEPPHRQGVEYINLESDDDEEGRHKKSVDQSTSKKNSNDPEELDLELKL